MFCLPFIIMILTQLTIANDVLYNSSSTITDISNYSTSWPSVLNETLDDSSLLENVSHTTETESFSVHHTIYIWTTFSNGTDNNHGYDDLTDPCVLITQVNGRMRKVCIEDKHGSNQSVSRPCSRSLTDMQNIRVDKIAFSNEDKPVELTWSCAKNSKCCDTGCCEDEGPISKWIWFSAGILGGLLLLVVISIMICYCCALKKKSKQEVRPAGIRIIKDKSGKLSDNSDRGSDSMISDTCEDTRTSSTQPLISSSFREPQPIRQPTAPVVGPVSAVATNKSVVAVPTEPVGGPSPVPVVTVPTAPPQTPELVLSWPPPPY